MTRTSRLSLKMRLLIPTILVLSASIIILSLIIIINQRQQMDGIKSSIFTSLDQANSRASDQFQRIGTEMEGQLSKIAEKVGSSLAESTQTALEAEQETIQKDIESSLAQNALSLAKLLAGVAPAAILANNYVDLISYAKSASQNPEIIYAIYLKPDGKPLTRHIDRKNPKIKEWIESGEGKKKIDKVLNASQADPSVQLIENPIELEGKALGKIILCVDKSITARKMEEMTARFAALIENNTAQVRTILKDQSGAVIAETQKLLSEVSQNNSATAVEMETALRDNLSRTEVSTFWTVTVVGGAGVILVALILFFLLSRVSNRIRGIVGDLNAVSSRVNDTTEQISQASQIVADGSSNQASAIEETSASLEEISSMTRQNADNLEKTRQLVTDTNSMVDKANKSMAALTREMGEISEASQETQKIVKTIDEIAFQTNLLALNAAVEAARAGEAGAGFAVVADEVRSLAIRAAEAARNTAQLIERTVKRIDEGEGLVKNTHQAFDEVAGSASQINSLIDDIANAANEEARGVDQINSAVTDMDRAVQQNAASSEESASASAELSREAGHMDVLVKNLVTFVDGGRAAEAAPGRAGEAYPEPEEELSFDDFGETGALPGPDGKKRN